MSLSHCGVDGSKNNAIMTLSNNIFCNIVFELNWVSTSLNLITILFSRKKISS